MGLAREKLISISFWWFFNFESCFHLPSALHPSLPSFHSHYPSSLPHSHPPSPSSTLPTLALSPLIPRGPTNAGVICPSEETPSTHLKSHHNTWRLLRVEEKRFIIFFSLILHQTNSTLNSQQPLPRQYIPNFGIASFHYCTASASVLSNHSIS